MKTKDEDENEKKKIKKTGMETDCEKLKKSSIYVKEWIIKQSKVKEESITDWLLFDISEKIERIAYKAFTRDEESRKTGADWEWWFIYKDHAFKMRVQAKKLKIGEDNYPALAYTNNNGLQIELLLNSSQQENFIPFYAFYSREANIVMCKQGINDEGVYMAGGNQIYADFILNGKRRVESNDLTERSIPLSCFLCCPLCHKDEGGFSRFLQNYYIKEIYPKEVEGKEIHDFEQGIRGLHRELPSYISSFIKYSKEGIPDWWEKEFHYQIRDVNSLIVYDARS